MTTTFLTDRSGVFGVGFVPEQPASCPRPHRRALTLLTALLNRPLLFDIGNDLIYITLASVRLLQLPTEVFNAGLGLFVLAFQFFVLRTASEKLSYCFRAVSIEFLFGDIR